MTAEEKKSIDERMSLLEGKAQATRSRLLRAIDALDQRRRQVVKIGTDAKRLAVPAVLSVAGVAALFGGSVFLFVMALRTRRQRSLSYRVQRQIQRMDLVGRPSLMRRMLEKAALTLVTMALSELGRRASKNLIDGRYPTGRLVAKHELERARVGSDGPERILVR